MEFVPLKDEEVDGSFVPVMTVQGILRHPRQDRKPGPDGKIPARRWLVPDHDRWRDVPGYPDFLWDGSKATPGTIRPLTAEELREYLAMKAGKVLVPAGAGNTDGELSLVVERTSIRIGGDEVPLSAREFRLLKETVERKRLPREEASKMLEAVPPESSQGVRGIVEYDALHGHRKAILRKVGATAGPRAKALLGGAFHGRGRAFVYDERILPVAKV